jgi:Lon-like ATP-dependent protease
MLGPLLDRIEIINVPAYLPVEKINIAKNYLVPKFEEEYGFGEEHHSHEKVSITDASLIDVINSYCGHEAGVRNLRKCIDRIFRKIVAKLEMKKIDDQEKLGTPVESTEEAAAAGHHLIDDLEVAKHYQINTKNLEQFLDVAPTDDTFYKGINEMLPKGSSNGLAYVNDGYGAVLKIQFVKKTYGKYAHKEDKDGKDKSEGSLTHTGRLGETMRESLDVVKIAVFNYIQNNKLYEGFDKEAYHLHVPMGATPKDGPSAGTSLFAALMSIATDKSVCGNLAMTGEITTLGEVISIGGVREKLTACKNHQISRVILPLSNKKNVKKLPDEFKKGFTIFYVKNVDQLYNICFNLDQNSQDFEFLENLGVEIEKHGEDKFMNDILNHEQIWEDNLINKL